MHTRTHTPHTYRIQHYCRSTLDACPFGNKTASRSPAEPKAKTFSTGSFATQKYTGRPFDMKGKRGRQADVDTHNSGDFVILVNSLPCIHRHSINKGKFNSLLIAEYLYHMMCTANPGTVSSFDFCGRGPALGP